LFTRKISIDIRLSLTAIFLLTSLAACQDHTFDVTPQTPSPGQNIRPKSPNPDWAPNIDPPMWAVVEEFLRLNPIPFTQLTPQEARQRPTIKDAVNNLLRENNITPPPVNVTITEQMIPGWNGASLRAKIYTPKTGTGPFPVIVYFHGGGWVIADADVYEASTIALSQNTGAVVVSVDYRRAPEHKFPTAHEDAFASYQWVRANAATINGKPDKIAVAGESAGGNLAAAVCLMAKERSVPMPLHQLLVYPIANNDFNTESYQRYTNAKPLDKPLMMWFFEQYLNNPAEGEHPYISLVDKADLSGVPPATIIGAQIDPLQTEGKQLADKLQSLGVPVAYQLYEGVTHEFFGTYAIVPDAARAQDFAAERLREALK
jgi:acetyl esterase/lipase